MEVLITGGAGYIGSHTTISLINSGFTPVLIDNFCNSKPEQLEKIESITGTKVKFYQCDIADRTSMDQVFQENNIDLVIHFAALKVVEESLREPLRYYENNVSGTLTLLRKMIENNVKKIVFSSSASVYDTDQHPPFHEMDAVRSDVPYAKTKIVVENILKDICAANSDFAAIVLRYFNPIGAHTSGIIGEDPKQSPANIMPKILNVASSTDEVFEIFGSDYNTHDGTAIRDYIHVMDIAEGHVRAANKLVDFLGYEVLNLGTGKGTSIIDLIQTFVKTNYVEVKYQLTDRRLGDIPISYADVSKAKEWLEWQAKFTLTDMVRDSWKYYCKYR